MRFHRMDWILPRLIIFPEYHQMSLLVVHPHCVGRSTCGVPGSYRLLPELHDRVAM